MLRSISLGAVRSNAVALSPLRRCLSTPAAPQIDRRVKQLIEDTIKKNDLVVFMKGSPSWPKCGFSRLVIQILHLHGVEDFKTLDVLEDQDLREGVKLYSNWPTIPQVYLKGEFIGGADIMRNMHESGELSGMLADLKSE